MKVLSFCKHKGQEFLQSVILTWFLRKWLENNLTKTLQNERKLVILQAIWKQTANLLDKSQCKGKRQKAKGKR